MDTRKISYTKQLADKATVQQRLAGLLQGYISGVMELPTKGLEYLAPDAGYTPGELTSSPKDKLRGDRFAWEEHRQHRMQNPDYARGDTLSYGPQIALDPFMDIPLGLAARAGKAYQAARGLGQFGRQLSPEAGAIIMKDGKPLSTYHGTRKAFRDFDPRLRSQATGAVDATQGTFLGESPDTANEYAMAITNILEKLRLPDVDAIPDLLFSEELLRMFKELEPTLKPNQWKDSPKIADFLLNYGGTDSSRFPNVRRHYLDVDNPKVIDYLGNEYDEDEFATLISSAKNAGHDSVILKNARDSGPNDNIYVAFNEAKQIIPAWEYDYQQLKGLGSFGKK